MPWGSCRSTSRGKSSKGAASKAESKAAIPLTGSANAAGTRSAAPLPSNPESSDRHTVSPAGCRSRCETYHEFIQAKLDQQHPLARAIALSKSPFDGQCCGQKIALHVGGEFSMV
jgi:hypothetical protein